MERPDRQGTGFQVRDPGCCHDGEQDCFSQRSSRHTVGEFLGVAQSGHAFRVMTIDVHEVQDGRVPRTYHVEDWARAARRLRARIEASYTRESRLSFPAVAGLGGGLFKE